MRLAAALERLVAPGVVSNRDFLVAALTHPAFLAGDTTTDFIERHAPALARTPSDDAVRAACLAAALAAQLARRAEASVLRTIASGWRNNPSAMQETRYRLARGPAREIAIGYRRERDGAFRCDLDGVAATARIARAALPEIDLEIDGVRRAFRVTRDGRAVYAQDARGEIALDELPRFPEREAIEHAAGGCVAPMPGKVLDVRVKPGDAVTRGQGLLTMEAMKMEHLVTAPSDGVVAEVRVAAGQQVDAGLVLIVIDARDGGSPDAR